MNRRVVLQRVGSAKVALLLLVLSPAAAFAQQPTLEGVVSPQPFKPREQLAQPNLARGELLLFGVHRVVALALAPLVEVGVESGALGTGSGSIGGLKISPGSLGSGSGVGLSVDAVYYSEPLWAGASAGATLKGYMEHAVFIGVRNPRGTYYLRATGTYDLDTEDEFSGLGMDSPENGETDYRQEEIRLLGDGQVTFAENGRFGLRGGYRKHTLLEGKNDEFKDIRTVFGDTLLTELGTILPGIGEEGKYGQGGAFLAYDTRNDPNNADRGVLLAGAFDAYRGLSDTPFDWNRFAGEFVGYLPIPDETRVIALRLLGVHQEPLDGAVLVPFYYLNSLGGGSLLRSFSSFRFQDNDLLYGSLELRRRVWAEEEGQAALDASLFAESGGVYRDLTDDVELGEMEQTFGTELRLLVPNDVVARLGVAVGSSEGARFYVGGGGRF